MKKKKNSNKGFTLIELLAVVVILLAISVMAISSISAAIERNKAKQDDAKKDVIVSYARLYYDEHKNSLTKRSNKVITIDELDLSEEEMTNSNGEKFSGCVTYDARGTNFEYVDNCN